MKLTPYAKFSWFVLLYYVFVIVYGAFVRATGSGAGCGAHWPLCNGVVIPSEPAIATTIEFFHRVTSGLTLPLAFGLAIWGWKIFGKMSKGRLWTALVVVFTITEALIGAGLVLLGLVADNDSMIRVYSMISHLVNTFLLLGSITLAAWWATFGEPVVSLKGIRRKFIVIVGIIGMILLGASGAVAALGDTLFPVNSLAEGFAQDMDSTAHIILRIRVSHPALAVLVSGILVWSAFKFAELNKGGISFRLAMILSGLLIFQLGLGMVNILLLAPVWLQLVHLLVTTSIWITFSMVCITGLVMFNFSPSVIEHKINHWIDHRSKQAH